MAAVQEISMYAAVAAVLSEVDDALTCKEEQRTALKQFLSGKNVFYPKTTRRIVFSHVHLVSPLKLIAQHQTFAPCLNKTCFMDLLLEEYM